MQYLLYFMHALVLHYRWDGGGIGDGARPSKKVVTPTVWLRSKYVCTRIALPSRFGGDCGGAAAYTRIITQRSARITVPRTRYVCIYLFLLTTRRRRLYTCILRSISGIYIYIHTIIPSPVPCIKRPKRMSPCTRSCTLRAVSKIVEVPVPQKPPRTSPLIGHPTFSSSSIISWP